MRKQVLRGTAIRQDDLLNRERTLQQKHLLVTVDQAHGRVFSDVPIIGFKNAKSVKDHLARAALPQLDRE